MMAANKATMFWLAFMSLVITASSASSSTSSPSSSSSSSSSSSFSSTTSATTSTTTTTKPQLTIVSENSNLYFKVPVPEEEVLAGDNGAVPRLFVRYSHGTGESLDDSMVTTSVFEAQMKAMEESYQQKIDDLRTELNNRVDEEARQRKSQEEKAAADITLEETERIEEDGVLDQAIKDEAETREMKDNELSKALTTEETAREREDGSLNGAIGDEETAREREDGILSGAIGDEKTAREREDGILSGAIGDEKTAREREDGILSGAIGDEKTARSDKDSLISNDIVQIKKAIADLKVPASCKEAGGGSGLKEIKLKEYSEPVTVYCEMTWEGGGWDTLMAIGGSSTEFQFDASHWKGTSTHRHTEGVDWGSNNKYHSFNYGKYCELMAWWRDPHDGQEWSWLTPSGFNKNWTPLKYFDTSRTIASDLPANVQNQQEWTRSGGRFSMQSRAARLSINQCTAGNSACSRWGFHTNENGWGDLSSNDAGGGLGQKPRFDAKSAGDWISCCIHGDRSNTGRNRDFDVRLLGRACS